MASSSSSSPEIVMAPSSDHQEPFSYKHATHDEVLEDLSSRFILNLPDEELASLERICFQVEQAHWFYEDFIREANPKFPSLPLKKFSAMLFHSCPLLHQWSHDHEQAFNTFMQYKTRVPVCGAIMLNDTWEKCILVKGWKSSSGWGFPKGKINEHEPPHDCAMREVLEETGYNLAGKLNPEDVIEMSIKEQKISLYIVPGVPEDYPFKTRTRKEISRIEWFRLTDLPTWKRNKAAPGKFYLISPFIGALKAFIHERKHRRPASGGVKISQSSHRGNIASADSINCDANGQDSGSQSSSADNAEPQTPSPQYPQATAIAQPSIIVSHGRDDGFSKLDEENLDPHFARLLNSLTLSAANAADHQPKSSADAIPHNQIVSEPFASTTPVPPPVAPTLLQPLTESKGADWSSRVSHQHSSEKSLDDSLVSSPSNQSSSQNAPQATSKSSPVITPDSTQTSHLNGPQSLSRGSQVPPISQSPASLKASPSDALKLSPASAVKPSITSRRTSSAADAFPYLCRPSEIPTSGKRLKQLALLESVADESAKLTPILSRGALPSKNGLPAMIPGGAIHPGPPASVPPPSSFQTHNFGLNDRLMTYPSRPIFHGSAASSAFSYTSPAHTGISVHDDPFQVRPQTSHFIAHNTPPAQSRPDAHQTHLLSLLSKPAVPQGHPAQMASYPHFQQQPPNSQYIPGLPSTLPLSSAAFPSQYVQQPHTSPMAPRVVHPPTMPSQFLPPHTSPQFMPGTTGSSFLAPNFSFPSSDARHPVTTSASLLSILNGRGSTRATSASRPSMNQSTVASNSIPR